MKDNLLTENLKELTVLTKEYINAYTKLLKLNITEKISKISSLILSGIIIFSIGFMIVLFLTFAFCSWYGNTHGSLWEGFLIAAGFYGLLTVLIVIFRKYLITNNIVKLVANIVFSDDD
ncbi:MAG: hypothetical protein ACOCUL_01110 [Bacteroidota bacterium]